MRSVVWSQILDYTEAPPATGWDWPRNKVTLNIVWSPLKKICVAVVTTDNGWKRKNTFPVIAGDWSDSANQIRQRIQRWQDERYMIVMTQQWHFTIHLIFFQGRVTTSSMILAAPKIDSVALMIQWVVTTSNNWVRWRHTFGWCLSKSVKVCAPTVAAGRLFDVEFDVELLTSQNF